MRIQIGIFTYLAVIVLSIRPVVFFVYMSFCEK